MAELVDALVSGTSGSNTLEVRVFLCPPYVKEKRFGVVAQLVERCVRNAEVVSSNLISSTTDFHRSEARNENRVSRRSVSEDEKTKSKESPGDMAEW